MTDLEIPESWLAHEGVAVLRPEEISLPVRARDSYKGDYGRVLILGGSVGYTGAVNLCTHAAVRAGAGLVSVGVPEAIYPITAVKQDEAMPFPLHAPLNAGEVFDRLARADVCVTGPGMGRAADAVRFVQDVLRETAVPTVVDADGLYALSRDLRILETTKAPFILTPHAGEFTRLGGTLTDDRVADARRFVERHPCVLVLKGHRTVIAFPDGETLILAAGNPGMAKGGSGDVLAGILGGMLGQLPLKDAVRAGVCIHADAGDRCAAELGEYAMTPSDMIAAIPAVTKTMTGR